MPLFHAPNPIHQQIIGLPCVLLVLTIHPDFLNFVHFPLKMYIVSSWSSGNVFLPGMFLVWSPGGRVNLWATPLTPGPSGAHGRHLVNGPGKQKDYWALLTVKTSQTQESLDNVEFYLKVKESPHHFAFWKMADHQGWLFPMWLRWVSQLLSYSPMMKPDTDLPNVHSWLAGLIYPQQSIRTKFELTFIQGHHQCEGQTAAPLPKTHWSRVEYSPMYFLIHPTFPRIVVSVWLIPF